MNHTISINVPIISAANWRVISLVRPPYPTISMRSILLLVMFKCLSYLFYLLFKINKTTWTFKFSLHKALEIFRHNCTIGLVDLTLEFIQWEQELDLGIFLIFCDFISKRVWWNLIWSKHVTLLWLLSPPGVKSYENLLVRARLDLLYLHYTIIYSIITKYLSTSIKSLRPMSWTVNLFETNLS